MSCAIDDHQQYVSPPEIAKVLRVSHAKVLRWIRSGDLLAADLATHRGQRPRWRIARSDLDDFLAHRAATPLPQPGRRRRFRGNEHVIEFYR